MNVIEVYVKWFNVVQEEIVKVIEGVGGKWCYLCVGDEVGVWVWYCCGVFCL